MVSFTKFEQIWMKISVEQFLGVQKTNMIMKIAKDELVSRQTSLTLQTSRIFVKIDTLLFLDTLKT